MLISTSMTMALALTLGFEVSSGQPVQPSAGPVIRAPEWERKFPDPTAPKPILQVVPTEPCIGEMMTISGKGGIPRAHIFFVLAVADPDDSDKPHFATIGEGSTNDQGDFAFKFKLNAAMKHIIPPQELEILPGTKYRINVLIDGYRTVDTIYFNTHR